NAKLETLQEKPSFRKNKRCLVPTDGFFEWQWQDLMGKKKQKYKIVIGQEELFMFAGLWDTWLDVATGELVYTFAVVTTEAQGIMRQIHNTKLRMPLVLTNEQEQNWLLNKVVEPFSNFEAKPVE
ncbi:MAG: SOS response-associated peptidase, partial [Flavobacteriaceae bacterium]|nr:SOS response-associated peptidase [Flavobacteriaceae bacterium]